MLNYCISLCKKTNKIGKVILHFPFSIPSSEVTHKYAVNMSKSTKFSINSSLSMLNKIFF